MFTISLIRRNHFVWHTDKQCLLQNRIQSKASISPMRCQSGTQDKIHCKVWGKADRENLWLKKLDNDSIDRLVLASNHMVQINTFCFESQESSQGHLKDTGFNKSTILTNTMRATGPRNPKSAQLSNDSQHLIYEIQILSYYIHCLFVKEWPLLVLKNSLGYCRIIKTNLIYENC